MLFRVAEVVGCTVRKLMTGVDGPLDEEELYGWAAYLRKKSEIEAQALEDAKKGRK